MKFSRAPRVGPSGTERGAALVIILAFLVLLTGIVAVFLSRALNQQKGSASSANQTKTDMLARSAVDMIVGDLKQEIVYGSSNTIVGPSTNQTTLYFPMTATNMVPQRTGLATNSAGTDLAPNLVRRSIRSDTLTVPSRASALSSTNATPSGRSISMARWNSHYLVPRLNAGSSSVDSTPITQFTAPDWVMVTKSGPKTLTVPDQTTIGRYAYAIYDEGGLLDANVAGYPSSIVLSPPSTQTIDGVAATVNGKGSLALADLTAIGMTQADVDNLVGWRNYATVQPTGSLGSFTFPSPTGTNYYGYVLGATNAFLSVNPQSYNSRTDQAFTTRQALLKFQRATGFSQDALQYLGTFSRDVEQPSFVPDSTRPRNNTHPLKAPYATGSVSTVGYGGNDAYYATPPADPLTGAVAHQDDINPALLSVRDTSGQAVFKRRFPLSRLAYVVTPYAAPISSTNAANIKKYFGLVWDATNYRWTYTSPDGNTARSGIKTLAQIGNKQMINDSTGQTVTDPNATQREPDFFETLKAVINCDSLGKQNGIGDGAGGTGSDHVFKVNSAAIDGRIDYQIFKIGADIIDQYDSDSYPTRIYIADKPTVTASSGTSTPAVPYDNSLQASASSAYSTYPREIYGTENVPYLYGQMVGWYRTLTLSDADIDPTYQPPSGTHPVDSGTPSFSGHPFYEVAALMQPILWNPSVAASTAVYSGSANYPAGFQVVAGDVWKSGVTDAISVAAYHPWWMGSLSGTASVSQYPAVGGLTPASYSTTSIGPLIPSSGGDPPSYIQFQTSATSDFREPYRLHAPNDPPGSNTTAYANGTINSADLEETSFTQAVGFYLGKAWAGPVFTDSSKHSYLDEGSPSANVRLHLQYKNPYGSSPTYLTYDTISYTYLSSANGHGHSLIASDDTVNKIRSMDGEFRMGGDPRTDRWGVGNAPICPFWDSRFTKWDGLTGKPSWMTTPIYNNAYGTSSIYYFPQGKTLGTGVAGDPLIKLAVQNNSVSWAPGWEHSTSNGLPVPNDTVLNYNTAVAGAGSNQPGKTMYYMDPDGVLRRAMGAYYDPSTKDGLPTNTGNTNSRPVILNRPFQSVAELGYAFRGQAWKDVDFFTPESGDTALLDAFCLNELPLASAPTSSSDVTVAGRINLNTRQSKVLQAMIQGVSKAEGGVISNTEAQNAAQALVNWTTADPTVASNNLNGVFKYGPLRNRGELVGKYVSSVTFTPPSPEANPTTVAVDGSKSYFGYSSALTTSVVAPATTAVFSNTSDSAIKRRRECVMRALSDSGNTRTWNLLIDVIAQTGRYPATATTAADLSKFIVTGETRYWVHVAIDRYTGNIVSESFEPVSE